MELLQLSETVILPVNETAYEKALLNEWEEQMERIDISTNEDKYLKILLKQDMTDKIRIDTLMELSESPVWKEAMKYL
jgi:spermidine/putrescine-binding protein